VSAWLAKVPGVKGKGGQRAKLGGEPQWAGRGPGGGDRRRESGGKKRASDRGETTRRWGRLRGGPWARCRREGLAMRNRRWGGGDNCPPTPVGRASGKRDQKKKIRRLVTGNENISGESKLGVQARKIAPRNNPCDHNERGPQRCLAASTPSSPGVVITTCHPMPGPRCKEANPEQGRGEKNRKTVLQTANKMVRAQAAHLRKELQKLEKEETLGKSTSRGGRTPRGATKPS